MWETLIAYPISRADDTREAGAMTQCESCGMPLDEEATSRVDGRYCIYCQDQESGDLASRENVREGSIQAAMRMMGKSRQEAERMADDLMPKLPRWRE